MTLIPDTNTIDDEIKEPDKFFDSLVRNAIDFLERSVEELEKYPKFSIINFYAAIELFLKARLYAEHWTLILSDLNKVKKKAKETTKFKFEKGDFQSVNIDRCIERLKDICGVKVSPTAHDYFKKVREHRNKMVHFFDPKYPPLTSEIVPEQMSAWYYLHKLIVDEWWEYFSRYEEDINELNFKVIGNKKFLEAKYKELEPQIEEDRQVGIVFSKCGLCEYEAAKHISSDFIHSKSCIVCHYEENQIYIECPDCKKEVIIEDGSGYCAECDFDIGFGELLSMLGPCEDPKEDPKVAYCAECEYHERSVIPLNEYGDCICLYCATIHDSSGTCQYCASYVAGIDISSSSAFGCIFCDGSFGADNS